MCPLLNLARPAKWREISAMNSTRSGDEHAGHCEFVLSMVVQLSGLALVAGLVTVLSRSRMAQSGESLRLL